MDFNEWYNIDLYWINTAIYIYDFRYWLGVDYSCVYGFGNDGLSDPTTFIHIWYCIITKYNEKLNSMDNMVYAYVSSWYISYGYGTSNWVIYNTF